MYPSLLGYTSMTLASGHWLHRPLSSFDKTTSPTDKFHFGWTLLTRVCRFYKNSWCHLSQNSLAKYCSLRHHFQQYISVLWIFPGDRSITFGSKVSKWLGVRFWCYFRWFVVSGLEWTMHSASFIRVLNALPSIWVPTPRSSGSNELRTVHIKCSHVPPMWLEWVYSSQMITTHNHSPQDNHINVPDLIIRKLQSFCFMHLQSLFVDHSEVVWLDHTSWGYDSRQLLLRRCSENWLSPDVHFCWPCK